MGYKFTIWCATDLRNDHASPMVWEEWHRSLWEKVFLAMLILLVILFLSGMPQKPTVYLCSTGILCHAVACWREKKGLKFDRAYLKDPGEISVIEMH